MKKEINDNLSQFRAHPDKARCQLKGDFTDMALRATLVRHLRAMLPELGGITLAGDSDDTVKARAQLDKLCMPDMWMRSAGSETSNLELGCLACIRYQIQGSRMLVCARFSELGAYARSLRGPKAMRQPANAAETSQWLKTASPERLAAALEAGVKIFVGVVGPSEMVYLPSGYIRCDRAVGLAGEKSVSEVYGVRMSTPFRGEPGAKQEFSTALADLLTLGKRNTVLVALVDNIGGASSGSGGVAAEPIQTAAAAPAASPTPSPAPQDDVTNAADQTAAPAADKAPASPDA